MLQGPAIYIATSIKKFPLVLAGHMEDSSVMRAYSIHGSDEQLEVGDHTQHAMVLKEIVAHTLRPKKKQRTEPLSAINHGIVINL